MTWGEIRDQLERYAGEPHYSLLPVLEILTDLNDDIWNMRDKEKCVRAVAEKLKAALDSVVEDYSL